MFYRATIISTISLSMYLHEQDCTWWFRKSTLTECIIFNKRFRVSLLAAGLNLPLFLNEILEVIDSCSQRSRDSANSARFFEFIPNGWASTNLSLFRRKIQWNVSFFVAKFTNSVFFSSRALFSSFFLVDS